MDYRNAIVVIVGLAFVVLAGFGFLTIQSATKGPGVPPGTAMWFLMLSIGTIGLAVLSCVFLGLKGGSARPSNLKAIGIIFVGLLASLLTMSGQGSAAAIGILGAILGYLFGRETPGDAG